MVLHATFIAGLLHLSVSPWAALPHTCGMVQRAMPSPSAAEAARHSSSFDGASLRIVVGDVVHDIDPLANGKLTVGPDGSALHGHVRFGTSDERDGSDRGGGSVAWSIATSGIQTMFLGLTVVNATPVQQDFTVVVGMPPGFVANTYGGTVVGMLNDLNGDGATITSVLAGSIYNAAIDGNDVFDLLGPAYSTSVPSGGFALVGPALFGVPIPNAPGPPMLQGAFMRYDFGLTPFDQATIQGTFTFAR